MRQVPLVAAAALLLFVSAASPAAAETLHDQVNNNPDLTSTDSTDYPAAGNKPAHDAETADDFTVPPGQTWTIESILVQGGGAIGPTFTVRFLANAGSLPGAPVQTFAQMPAPAGVNFQLTLPSPVTLGPGTYWLALQAHNNSDNGWTWDNRTVQSGHPAAWRNPGGGHPSAMASCRNAAFANRGACLNNAQDPDQVFQLSGTRTVFDGDLDGVQEGADNCPATANPKQENSDGTGDGGDACDSDDDNDGIADASDNCATAINPAQENSDGAGDGGDACDDDDDNDGLTDNSDNCVRVANADQANLDGINDGGDACDFDDDQDNAPDFSDNCATVANPDQLDRDKDGLGAACDPVDLFPGACTNPRDGTSAANKLTGTPAGDLLRGLGGNDRLSGLAGDDCLHGASGNDSLSGGDGADKLRGDSGNDRLSGGTGNDALVGGTGNDRLTGGTGKNSYSAGSGNDTVSARNGTRETISCGEGRDVASVDRRDTVSGCERVSRSRN